MVQPLFKWIMARHSILLLVLLALIPSVSQAEPVVLALLPMTGAQSEYGTAVSNGLRMALEGSGVALVVQDHGGRTADAASGFEAGLAKTPSEALVVFGSSPALAVAQKAQDRGIPMVAIASADLIQKDRPVVFRHMLSISVSADLLIAEATRRGLRSISVITTIHDGRLAFKELFKRKWHGGLLDDLEVDWKESDFRSIALLFKKKNPDGILIALMPPQAALFAQAIRATGYKGELFASNQVDSSSEFSLAGAAFNGLWFSRDGVLRDPVFEASYRKRFGRDLQTFSLNGFDVGSMLATGIRSGDVVKYLRGMSNFQGALGTYSANPDRTFSIPGSIWELRGGKPVMIGK